MFGNRLADKHIDRDKNLRGFFIEFYILFSNLIRPKPDITCILGLLYLTSHDFSTKGAIKNGQPRDTCNIEHKRQNESKQNK